MKNAGPACRDDRERRTALRSTELNGIDYLQVDETDRHRLTLYFIAKLRGLGDRLTPANFVITGGRRVPTVNVTEMKVCEQRDPDLDDCLTLTVDHIGDFSTYTLCIVDAIDGRPTGHPHPEIDPVYACLDFSFQVGCPSGADCVSSAVCPERPAVQPAIDYLAKDYASFKQLMLDRLTLLLPGWTERHEPDLLIALVELLAYEGDRLAYLQDAAATEAYLYTARQRISIRRHARLVDYQLSEGCNARAWVFVETSRDSEPLSLDDFFFVTSYPGAPQDGSILSINDIASVRPNSYEVFEPVKETHGTRRLRYVRRPTDLCNRLLKASDPVARFVRDHLRPDVRKALEHWKGRGDPPATLVRDLIADLETIARSQALTYEKAFADHASSPKSRELLRKPLGRRDLLRLNRLLLEAAFEKELASPDKIRFYERHNEIAFHTWGERACCLPRGTTMATLVDASFDPTDPTSDPATRRGLHLEPGDFLLFEEVRSPTTGLREDADPLHGHVVRLTNAIRRIDPVLHTALLEVEWAPEDALPFPICLSARGPAPECEWIEGVSVARGNVVLVDHGRRELDELDAVEVDAIEQPCDDCQPEQELVPARYRPLLSHADLTFAQPTVWQRSAHGLLVQDPHKALPALRLEQLPVVPPRLDLPDALERYRNPVPLTAFDTEDLLSPPPLLLRLQKADAAGAGDPLAAYVRGKLDAASLKALAAYSYPAEPPLELTAGVLAALNSALDDAALYDPHRFPSTLLDLPTAKLLEQRPLSIDLQRLLNRWLLEQAFADSVGPTERFIREWQPRFDLLESRPDDRQFVVEMTDDRRSYLRFGNDDLGHQPEASTRFRAFYRVGNGTRGNVGAESISVFVTRGEAIQGMTIHPRNPLAARGGTDPETLETARRRAPRAIRGQLVRAVTADDYAALATRDFPTELQGAAVDLVWTGSWYEADVSLDPWGREEAPRVLMKAVREDLGRYRRMGHDLRVATTRYVPLSITLHVCVKPDYLQAHVRAALVDVFSTRTLPDGTLGFFHPDSLRFAQSVDASRIIAAAQKAPGVLWCRVDKLERLGEGDAGEVAAGTLLLGRGEIARVDNAGGAGTRPGFPEFGSIVFDMDGGR